MSSVMIREAVKADIPAIIAIYATDREYGHGEADNPAPLSVYEAAFERIRASSDTTLYVAEREGQVVGTFQLTFIPALVGHGRTNAKIESVHVHESQRGTGVGAVMVAQAEAFARHGGAGALELSSNKARLAAHRFYERLGYDKSHEGFKKKL